MSTESQNQLRQPSIPDQIDINTIPTSKLVAGILHALIEPSDRFNFSGNTIQFIQQGLTRQAFTKQVGILFEVTKKPGSWISSPVPGAEIITRLGTICFGKADILGVLTLATNREVLRIEADMALPITD